jgi:hypothetical protein
LQEASPLALLVLGTQFRFSCGQRTLLNRRVREYKLMAKSMVVADLKSRENGRRRIGGNYGMRMHSALSHLPARWLRVLLGGVGLAALRAFAYSYDAMPEFRSAFTSACPPSPLAPLAPPPPSDVASATACTSCAMALRVGVRLWALPIRDETSSGVM